jgi:hypothetical protein
MEQRRNSLINKKIYLSTSLTAALLIKAGNATIKMRLIATTDSVDHGYIVFFIHGGEIQGLFIEHPG